MKLFNEQIFILKFMFVIHGGLIIPFNGTHAGLLLLLKDYL